MSRPPRGNLDQAMKQRFKFQEDGSWCPMRPKKESVKVSSQSIPKLEPSTPVRQCAMALPTGESGSAKKADVIDLTLETSSSSEDEEPDLPMKKRCVYMTKTEEIHSKGVLTYQPSTVRVPNVQTLDTPYLTSSLSDYPFHHSTLATIPADMQSLDLLSFLQADSQHYRAPMFLDNLSSSLQSSASSTSSALVSSSTSHYESSAHVATSSTHHETRVITGGGAGSAGQPLGSSGGSGGISDIISLD